MTKKYVIAQINRTIIVFYYGNGGAVDEIDEALRFDSLEEAEAHLKISFIFPMHNVTIIPIYNKN